MSAKSLLSSGHPDLIAEIAAEISNAGPIPFARFMELALYHPQFGYYIRPTGGPEPERIGWSGDFYTSSDVHPLLGRALARQIRQIDELLGHPALFTIVEMGAGKGLLARHILDACASESASFLNRLRYVLIERSPAMRELQCRNLASYLATPGRVSWVSGLSDLPNASLVGLFLSNELVDAFPVHRIHVVDGELKEIHVDYRDGRFVECLCPPSTPEIETHLHRMGVDLPNGYRTEINLEALRWMREVARVMNRGVVITVDYGHSAQDFFAPERHRGTFLCYYRQMVSEDPYTRVGEQDMTAHVDFTSLATVGEEAGLAVTGFTNQMSFLISLGAEHLLDTLDPESPEFRAALHLLRPEGMGRTFKILVQHKGIPRPELEGLTFKPFFGSALTAASAAANVVKS